MSRYVLQNFDHYAFPGQIKAIIIEQEMFGKIDESAFFAGQGRDIVQDEVIHHHVDGGLVTVDIGKGVIWIGAK